MKLFSDFADFSRLSLEGKGRGSCRDAKSFHMRKRVDDFFGYSIAEKFVFRICTHVRKRKNGYGFLCGHRSSLSGRFYSWRSGKKSFRRTFLKFSEFIDKIVNGLQSLIRIFLEALLNQSLQFKRHILFLPINGIRLVTQNG